MPELDTSLAQEYDRVRTHARGWQLRAAMAREHTLDLINDNRQWQREARTLIESCQRLARQRAVRPASAE